MWHDLPWGISTVDAAQAKKIEPDRIRCCVQGCRRELERAHRGAGRWNGACFCPEHFIRVSSTPTYVYRREEQHRNFIVDQGLAKKFAGAKTESWRLGNESSEDALTWNVFVGLLRLGLLREATRVLADVQSHTEPELLLWGSRFSDDGPRPWLELGEVRGRLERDFRIQTEPDIVLRIPGKALLLIEAKFGSRNSTLEGKESYESPEDFLEVYAGPSAESDPLEREWIEAQPKSAVLEQLCRMAVFGSWLRKANEEVIVVNLLRRADLEKGPPPFASHIRVDRGVRFAAKSWEDLAPLAKTASAATLHRYMMDKSLRLAPAFPTLQR